MRHIAPGFRHNASGFRREAAVGDHGRVRVVVERSGGFAGVVRRGEADGSQLDDVTAQQLRDLVTGAAGSGDAGPGSRRDGFCYQVTLHDDGTEDDGVQHVQLREGSMPPGARQLLDGLLR